MVSANDLDLNQSLEMKDIDQDDVMEAPGDPSYDKLYDDIMNSSGTFEMESDYAYSEGDNRTVIEVNQSSLVINGNNHIIDGSGKAGGFKFLKEGSKVIINDLTFTNCNESAIDHMKGGNITLNNVSFTNNSKTSGKSFTLGIIVTYLVDLTANNCNFYSNNAPNIIYADYGDITILNSHFYKYGEACTLYRCRPTGGHLQIL